MLNFPRIFFRGKKQDPELSKKNIIEENPLEQNEQNYEEQLDELSPVIEGQVSIHFTGVSPADGSLLVGFFVSNGLNQKVKFDNVPLVLMDSDRRVLARQSFDGEVIGEIVGGSTKACVVRFLPDNVYIQNIPEKCLVCFDVPDKRPQSINIQYQALPENTTEDQQQELERVLAELPPMKDGEVNFSPLHAQITTQSDLLATVIIRNSTDKTINLEQIPLAAFDAQREELARGLFDIKDLTIEPFKAIVWTFNFGNLSQDKDIDLSSWYINVVQ